MKTWLKTMWYITLISVIVGEVVDAMSGQGIAAGAVPVFLGGTTGLALGRIDAWFQRRRKHQQ